VVAPRLRTERRAHRPCTSAWCPGGEARVNIDDLLAAGTAALLKVRESNGKPLIADTDVANEPMAAAFERAGWTRFAGRREYVIALTPDRA
jgi:hypothetical protein